MGVIRTSVSQGKESSLVRRAPPAQGGPWSQPPSPVRAESASALLFPSLLPVYSELKSKQQRPPWVPTQRLTERSHCSEERWKVGEGQSRDAIPHPLIAQGFPKAWSPASQRCPQPLVLEGHGGRRESMPSGVTLGESASWFCHVLALGPGQQPPPTSRRPYFQVASSAKRNIQ